MRRASLAGFKHVAVVLALGSLVACGGGGGGGDGAAAPVANLVKLSSGNYVDAVRETITAGNLLQNTTNISTIVTGVDLAQPISVAGFVRAQLPRLPDWFRDAPRAAVGATASSSAACSVAGDVTVTVSDANNNGQMDRGDSVTAVFNNCKEGTLTTSGTFNLTVNAISGDPQGSVYAVDLSVGFTNLKFTQAAESATVSGAMRLLSESFATRDLKDSFSTDSLNIAGDTGGVAFSRLFTAFSTSYAYKAGGSDYRDALVLNGHLQSSYLGGQIVQLATVTPMVSGANGLLSGELRLSGAGGSKVRVTANGALAALIELDENGDGVYEANATRPW